MVKYLLILFSILFVAVNLYAKGPGQNSGLIMRLLYEPEIFGKGEIVTVHSKNLGAINGNPAGLAESSYTGIAFSHTDLVEEITINQIKAKYKNLGLGLAYMDYGDIEGRDRSGYYTGNVKAKDYVLTLALARTFTKKILGGVAVKYIDEQLESERAYAGAVDIGFVYNIRKSFTLGFTAENVGSKIKFVKQSFSLPLTFRLGYKLDLFGNRLQFSKEIVNEKHEGTTINFGLNYKLNSFIQLYAGYKNHYDLSKGISGGFEITLANLTFKFTYLPAGKFGSYTFFQIEKLWENAGK